MPARDDEVRFVAAADAAAGDRGISRSADPGTAIILFADVVDSAALTEQLGDAAFRARARELDDALRATMREHVGGAHADVTVSVSVSQCLSGFDERVVAGQSTIADNPGVEPRIQYAKTTDGLSIAVWMRGDGPAVIQTPPLPFAQVELSSRVPETDGEWTRGLWSGRMIVRYDGRGTGLSSRTASDYSLEAQLLDLDAVVSLLGPEPVALWSQITSGPIVIAYAATRPERVSHVLLWSSWARGADVLEEPAGRGLVALADADWNMFTETAAQALSAWSAGERAHRVAAFLRESVDVEAGRAILAALMEFDASELLGQVQAPTLVLHSRITPIPDVKVARRLAAGIPNARLIMQEEGAAMAPFAEGDVRTIAEFLGALSGSGAGAASRIMAVLFTDLVGHTEMMQRLGDARGREVLREHERITRETLGRYGGAEVKTMGDGFLASFGSLTSAMECAIALQRAFAAYSASAPEPLQVRVGLNAGEPIEEEGDLFGSMVIMASRIAGHAAAGEILIPEAVRHLLAGKSYTYTDRGEFAAKGFEERMRVYSVRWRDESDLVARADERPGDGD